MMEGGKQWLQAATLAALGAVAQPALAQEVPEDAAIIGVANLDPAELAKHRVTLVGKLRDYDEGNELVSEHLVTGSLGTPYALDDSRGVVFINFNSFGERRCIPVKSFVDVGDGYWYVYLDEIDQTHIRPGSCEENLSKAPVAVRLLNHEENEWINPNNLPDEALLAMNVVVEGEISPGITFSRESAIPTRRATESGTVFWEVNREDGVHCIATDQLESTVDANKWMIVDSNFYTHNDCDWLVTNFPDNIYADIADIDENKSENLGERTQNTSNLADNISLSAHFGSYFEEYDIETKGVNPDFRFELLFPLARSQWKIGATTQVLIPVGEMDRSGVGQTGMVIGRAVTVPRLGKELDLSFQGGYSRDYNPILNAFYVRVEGSMVLVDINAINGALVANVSLSHDFIGNGWLLAGDTGLSSGFGLGIQVYPVSYLDLERSPRPVNEVTPFELHTEVEGQQEVTGGHLVERTERYNRAAYKEVPNLDFDMTSDRSEQTSEVAELIRLESEVRKYLEESPMNNKALSRASFAALDHAEENNFQPSVDVYLAGFYSARNVGDMLLAYEFVKKIVDLGYSPEDAPNEWIDTLKDIEAHYGWVDLSGTELRMLTAPFEPVPRNSISRAAEICEIEGGFQGLLPTTVPMTLDGVSVTPEPLLTGHDLVLRVRP